MKNTIIRKSLTLFVVIGIPVAVLVFASHPGRLGHLWAFIVALSMPLAYGVQRLVRRRSWDTSAVAVVIGVLLTGAIFAFGLDPKWLAVKEATPPLLAGIVLLLARLAGFRVANWLFLSTVNRRRISTALKNSNEGKRGFRKISDCAGMALIVSMFVSATLNFVLARLIVTSDPGTAEFNKEFGVFTAMSLPVVALTAGVIILGTEMWFLVKVRQLTGLSFFEVLRRREDHIKPSS